MCCCSTRACCCCFLLILVIALIGFVFGFGVFAHGFHKLKEIFHTSHDGSFQGRPFIAFAPAPL